MRKRCRCGGGCACRLVTLCRRLAVRSQTGWFFASDFSDYRTTLAGLLFTILLFKHREESVSLERVCHVTGECVTGGSVSRDWRVCHWRECVTRLESVSLECHSTDVFLWNHHVFLPADPKRRLMGSTRGLGGTTRAQLLA